MKNHITYTLLTLCALWLAAGCANQEVPLYDGENYVQFTKAADTVTVAFFLHSNAGSYDYPVQVEMSGLASAGGPRAYTLEVDEEFSTVTSGQYSMPARTEFEAGQVTSTAHIRFNRTPEMKQKSFTLVLRVTDNANYAAGQARKRWLAIKVHDMIARPPWWNISYLGVYSDKKFECFLTANNHPDLDGITGNNQLMRVYALTLKRWLEEKALAGETVYEVDGSTKMVVGTSAFN